MLTTSVKIGNKYNYTEEKIEQALTFLRTTDFTGMEPGKVAIDGDGFSLKSGVHDERSERLPVRDSPEILRYPVCGRGGRILRIYPSF